ncbi:M56 family metallopeptidase [Asinibacterium sp. OR53]|uniref:M56 family metallopeptidase n=1 Tax=Asinibacterium sp. OR53 TaxID=925409 RepID=UPI0004B58BC0|nr:M56 family metallopeptidase [Asinibacterium sp. OR53]
MSQLFDYLIKASLCLGVVYLFYYWLLRPLTYYAWNRYFLLLATSLAFIIPLLPVDALMSDQPSAAVTFIRQFSLEKDQAAIASTAPERMALWQVLLPVFLVGSLVMLVRMLMQLTSLKKLRRSAPLLHERQYAFYQLPNEQSPFSFGNHVYLNRHLYNEEEFEKIIRHELVHVQQKHTIDVLLMEWVCIINWFNPFAWLIRQAAKQNLEFIADEQVLQEGHNRKGYQYLLLKVAREDQGFQLASPFLFPSLKKRIEMMNRDRTAGVHLLKFAVVLPLIVMLAVAFGQTSGKHSIKKADGEPYNLSSLTYRINDARVEAIVKEDQRNCLLKPGAALSLGLMSKEKDRLRTLLEQHGYANLPGNAIRFTIDTTLSPQRFAVEIAIHIANAGIQQVRLAQGNGYDQKAKDQTLIKQEKIINRVH